MTNKIRVVLVGCGGISGAWLDACSKMDDVKVAGLVDINGTAAHEKAQKYGLTDAVVGTDLKRILKQTKPDVVFDCTVPEGHADVTITALRHGCHVLGEKPLADSMANAKKMVKAAEKSGRTYAVMQNRRYDANIRRLKAFLDSKKLGDITAVNSDFYIGAHFGGFRAEMKHVLLLDMAIHTFDAARFISGANPVSVMARDWNPKNSWFKHGASAVAVFEMTDGIVYTYRGSWASEGHRTTWEADWHIICEKGSVKWDGADEFAAEAIIESDKFMRDCRGVGIPEIPTPKSGGHYGCIREFIDCIKTGTTPETVCTDNIKSLAMVFAAIRNTETGKCAILRR